MNAQYLLPISIAVIFSLSISAACAESNPDVDKDLMYFMEETVDRLNADLAMKRKQESLEGADLMVELSHMVEEHFLSWVGNERAIKLATEGKQHSMKIADLLRAEEYDAAVQESIALSSNCKSCHELF
jgi:DNA-binding SARP family transcriptional activator